jgi:flagellar biosynthesis/type III secretory pathway chaperone
MPVHTVIDALAEQVGCYRRLAKLTEVQHDHVRRGRIEELLGVLGQRQEILDIVADLEQTIGPIKRRWTEYLLELPADERVKAESLMADARKLLEQITSADRNDALVLQQRKLNVGKQIQQFTAARQVNRKYSVAAYGARAPRMDVVS